MDWSLKFSTSIFILLLILFTSLLISVYYYRITVPEINRIKKIILIFLRAFSLSLIFFLLLSLTLSVLKSDSFFPKTYFFIDNSKSIKSDDSSMSISNVKNIVDLINKKNYSTIKIFSFGEKIKKISPKSFVYNPLERFTNFETITEKIESAGDSVNSVLIISDGNVTNGSESVELFKNLNLPIFTIGLSSEKTYKDISIKDVQYNKYLYRNKSVEIKVKIFNEGFLNQKINCELYENQKLTSQKALDLSESGLDEVSFQYIPIESGLKKLELRISVLEGEADKRNNNYKFELRVLEDKINISFIASYPTSDLSAIKLAASSDTNRFLFNYVDGIDNSKLNTVLEKSDILFIIGYPSNTTSNSDLLRLVNYIEEKKKPFFFLINNNSDFNKIDILNKILPYSLKSVNNKFTFKSIQFNNSAFSFFKNYNPDELKFWNNLPPINLFNLNVSQEKNSIVLAETIEKSPVIIIGNKNAIKSFSILGFDIWRWLLQNSNIAKENFTNFIDKIIKWLNAPLYEDKFIVKPLKQSFFENEEILFQAELFDSKYIPIENAEINLNVRDSLNSIKTNFDYIGNGFYEARLNAGLKGNLFYEAETKNEFGQPIKFSGKLFVESKEIELTKLGLNSNFLKNISLSTGGEYLLSDEIEITLDKLEKYNLHHSKQISSSFTFEIFQSKFILILLITLLIIEWLIRKLNYLN